MASGVTESTHRFHEPSRKRRWEEAVAAAKGAFLAARRGRDVAGCPLHACCGGCAGAHADLGAHCDVGAQSSRDSGREVPASEARKMRRVLQADVGTPISPLPGSLKDPFAS